MRPNPPNPDTQEARILAVLLDGRSHTLYDWPRDDVYTGRNAISRLKKRGYKIKSWKKPRQKVWTYQLAIEQGELQLAGCLASTQEGR